MNALAAFFTNFLVKLAVDVLAYLQAREDLKRRVLAEAQSRGDQRAIEALRWLADAAGRPDGGADLRVRPGAPDVPRESAGASEDPPRLPRRGRVVHLPVVGGLRDDRPGTQGVLFGDREQP